jgi:hypothetical protein
MSIATAAATGRPAVRAAQDDWARAGTDLVAWFNAVIYRGAPPDGELAPGEPPAPAGETTGEG